MPPILLYAIPVFVVTLILEIWWLHKRQANNTQQSISPKGYEPKDTAASLSMGIGNLLVNAPLKLWVIALYFGLYELRPWTLDTSHWASWIALFVAFDCSYYWWHRLGHRCRFFWAGHVNHHSSQHYNLSTALRQPWVLPLFKPWFFAPLILLGFHPLALLSIQAFNLLYQYWIHTESIHKLPAWFEWWFNTPSHHRVHHGSNPEYLDCNYGGTLMVWDRLFGSFVPEQAPVNYGLTKNIETFNPIRIALHEWQAIFADLRQCRSMADARLALLGPPGSFTTRDSNATEQSHHQ